MIQLLIARGNLTPQWLFYEATDTDIATVLEVLEEEEEASRRG